MAWNKQQKRNFHENAHTGAGRPVGLTTCTALEKTIITTMIIIKMP